MSRKKKKQHRYGPSISVFSPSIIAMPASPALFSRFLVAYPREQLLQSSPGSRREKEERERSFGVAISVFFFCRRRSLFSRPSSLSKEESRGAGDGKSEKEGEKNSASTSSDFAKEKEQKNPCALSLVSLPISLSFTPPQRIPQLPPRPFWIASSQQRGQRPGPPPPRQSRRGTAARRGGRSREPLRSSLSP